MAGVTARFIRLVSEALGVAREIVVMNDRAIVADQNNPVGRRLQADDVGAPSLRSRAFWWFVPDIEDTGIPSQLPEIGRWTWPKKMCRMFGKRRTVRANAAFSRIRYWS